MTAQEKKREYNQRYYLANRDRLKQENNDYYWNNRDECCKRMRERHAENPQLHRDSVHRSYRKNLAKRTAYNRRYSSNNAAALAFKRRDYAKRNPVVIRERNRRYVLANPEKQREWMHKWYVKNRARVREWGREYDKSHPWVAVIKYNRRRARKLSALTDGTAEAFIKQIRKTDSIQCTYCGNIITGKAIHIDHIVPLSRGGSHTKDNLCPACYSCNCSKSNKLLSEWIPPNRQSIVNANKERGILSLSQV